MNWGRRGVRRLLIERNSRVGFAPRAKTTNVRTRTHLRRWGIADKLAAASPFGVDYPNDVVFATRLLGPPLSRIKNAFNAAPTRDDRYPEHAQWIPQYKLEEVLRTRATEFESVEIRFNSEYLTLEQDADGVTARLRDCVEDREYLIRAHYLVGADGSRSGVRETIGASMSGRPGLSRNYNIIFRAPGLANKHPHGPAIMYWLINKDVPGVMGPMDNGDVWYFAITEVPVGIVLSKEQMLKAIKSATGIDIDYEILSADEWVASRLIADKYRDGRAFLIGDAAHIHPPWGGYCMNMGVGDAADLGWKLASVLQGWGGNPLLESYESERRPLHEWIMDEAEANHALLPAQLLQPGIDADTDTGKNLRRVVGEKIAEMKQREFYTLGAILGYCYENSPVLFKEKGGRQNQSQTYQPCSRPGCLAPHFWFTDKLSLYDCFGDGLNLVVRGRQIGTDQATKQAQPLKIPFTVTLLPNSIPKELYPCTFTLVRPDQHVCWRGASWRDDVLEHVTGRPVAI